MNNNIITEIYKIHITMGTISNHSKLSFLTKKEFKEFNLIRCDSKNYEYFLNSLKKGKFIVDETWNNGIEHISFTIFRAYTR